MSNSTAKKGQPPGLLLSFCILRFVRFAPRPIERQGIVLDSKWLSLVDKYVEVVDNIVDDTGYGGTLLSTLK